MNLTGMKELTIGGVNLKELSIDGVKTWQSGRLPADFTELEYIEATGTQYIDLGITGQNGLSVELNIEVLSPVNSGGSCIIGSTNSSSQRCYITANPSYQPFAWELGAGNYYVDHEDLAKFNQKYKLHIDWTKAKTVLKVDDVETTTLQNSFTFDNNNTNMTLFARNKSGTAEKFARARAHKDQYVWINGVLVGQFVPARHRGGTLGLYNLLTNEFHINAGTGEFIAGTVVG